MILVPCPNCGSRNATEFRWCGEVLERPDPASASPSQWRRYLYFKKNRAGWSLETWYHRAGCGRYFRLERNTMSDEFRTAKVGRALAATEKQEGGTD